MTSSLRKESPLGKKWGSFLVAAMPYSRDNGSNLYTAWPISTIAENKLEGPIIYAAIARGECLYVGQTRDTLRARIKRHIRDSKKAAAWMHVLAIELQLDVPARVMDELESRGKTVLDPVMGSRWGRRKR